MVQATGQQTTYSYIKTYRLDGLMKASGQDDKKRLDN